MKILDSHKTVLAMTFLSIFSVASAKNANDSANVDNSVIENQRMALEANTDGKGYGPQSPRDIDSIEGSNKRVFGFAPERSSMNLCNIHFHKNAEHKGGEYTKYAGNGDGKGKNTGYVANTELSEAQLEPTKLNICGATDHPLKAGDTIEVHWVYTSAQIKPGPTLGSCLAESTMNPGLRVEGQVFTLANDSSALDFNKLAMVANENGYSQAPNIPSNTGTPIEYLGSTTGPSYNEKASPLQVSWSMRPKVAILDINSVGEWCKENIFNEDHAHGVRNLVINPKLLSATQ